MSLQELPLVVATLTEYEFSLVLDGTRYYLEFHYNGRIDTWFASLKDSNKQVLIHGIPCLTSVENMFTRFKLDNVLPFGDTIVLDSNGLGGDPTFLNFGLNISMFYASIINA